MANNKKLLNTYIQWINTYKWRFFVTLHFNSSFKATHISTELIVRKFGTRLNNIFNGRNTVENLSLFPVLETSKSGIKHVHILIGHECSKNLNTEIIKGIVAFEWGKLRHCISPSYLGSGNDEWFKIVSEKQETLITYLCKEFKYGTNPVLINALNLNVTKY
jgi:hypothetical protein